MALNNRDAFHFLTWSLWKNGESELFRASKELNIHIITGSE